MITDKSIIFDSKFKYMPEYDFIVVGGGAAGFFAAINAKKMNPSLKIAILEMQSKFLQKVKISGGGRCNVTNAIKDPDLLADHYPRGGEFLKEPFREFNTADIKKWFGDRGIKLKTESDGRVFPVTDSSETIIQCFLNEAKSIDLVTKCRVNDFTQIKNGWEVKAANGKIFTTKKLMIACGADKRIWETLKSLNLKINPEAPSLFTFKIQDKYLTNLQGISFPNAKLKIPESSIEQSGPLLITHWGLSGPVVLKLSAWAAYYLQEKNYHFPISVNWLSDLSEKDLIKKLNDTIQSNPRKQIRSLNPFNTASRFWHFVCDSADIGSYQNGAETGKKHIQKVCDILQDSIFEVTGKSTFKEEFVTAGGINTDEINPNTFQSLKYPNLYLAGEVLDIDALTGGFNFQAAWTGGYLIAKHISTKKIN